MKMRNNKGKVSPSPASFPAGDSLAVLNLLPAAIVTLAVTLSLEDRQVLAYMITRSIKSTNPRSSDNNNNNKKNNNNKSSAVHKSPVFDCDCFDCYTNYWFRWDTSANRELIHQVIEAFEENLTSTEQVNCRGRKPKKPSHRKLAGKTLTLPPPPLPEVSVSPTYDVALAEEYAGELDDVAEESPPSPETDATSVVRGSPARKVMPDVKGLFNWRLWGIWSP
ncbi:uncharacterized protein LOC143535216 [Bidens hawaiensis]|uniref:uncharacterized protein LOC143535216 n=1 Tax=Bidens hawaiensis TaxID=980011 RepID=UPI00404B500A